jgi:hypothetical protein
VKGLNLYCRSAEISEPKTRQIIEYFALDLTAKKTKPESSLSLPLTALLEKQHNKFFLNVSHL